MSSTHEDYKRQSADNFPANESTLTQELLNQRDRLIAENAALRDVLQHNGFVQCDIPACNCGSWHDRYGLPERFAELKEVLADAGHPLCNENGNLISRALGGLIVERDALRARCEEQEKKIAILELKNKGTLANNLCPDCRDKQVGKPCLACTIQSQEKVIEMAMDALDGWKEIFENCTIESGTCCCGNRMLHHPMDDHQPVDYGTYIAGQVYDKTTETLAAMKEKT